MVVPCGEFREIPNREEIPIRVLFAVTLTMIPLTAQAHTPLSPRWLWAIPLLILLGAVVDGTVG